MQIVIKSPRRESKEPQPVYLVCGVSGAGKSWVCRQLTKKFHYIPHDRCWVHPDKDDWGPESVWEAGMGDDSKYLPGAKSNHSAVIIEASRIAKKPILTECPHGERVTREELEENGITVHPYFVIEEPEVVQKRYFGREGKELPKAANTRASSIRNRAEEWGAPSGTSSEVYQMLKDLKV